LSRKKSNPFEAGDWGYSKGSETYFRVLSSGYSLETTNGSYSPSYIKEHLEKIEEPWKIALLESGRGTPEFVIGDKITSVSEGPHTVHEGNVDGIKEFIENGTIVVKYIYPVESRIEVNS
jgi:hypothetical protein